MPPYTIKEAESERTHRAISAKALAGGWEEKASDVLDCADMLVAYCECERVKRRGEPGVPGRGQWRGTWKRYPYRNAIRRAMYLLAMRRGQKGRMRLANGWKERLYEAGVDFETMDIIPGEEKKWARAWKQFREYDGFTISRQRRWNVMGVEAEWPPPEIGWRARENSRGRRKLVESKWGIEASKGKEEAEEVPVPVRKKSVLERYKERLESLD